MISSNIPLFRICDKHLVKKFLHACVDDLIDRKKAIYNNINNDIEWTKEDFLLSLNSIQNLFKKSVINEDFNISEEIGNLDEEQQEVVLECYNIRKNEILNHTIKQYAYKINKPLLEDFDWKIKLVMGSSKYSNFREPLLQVNLFCNEEQDGKDTKSIVNFEVNENELTNLISVLESAL